jgi:sec-independent protein translocase protein TatA
MPDIGWPELILVAVIVLLLFGPGKASDIGGALGKSIREFRKASRDDDGESSPPALTASSGSTDQPAASQPAATRFCTECGASIVSDSQKFCMNCGKPVSALTSA